MAPEGAQLIGPGLSTEVVETILQSRAPSMRKLYALKWKLFTSWCGDRQLDPVNCQIGTVLEFLQAQLSAGLTHSTLRVYMATIAAYHDPLGGQSVSKDPLVAHLLHGVMRLRPQVRSRVPPWDLAVVLEALCRPPFEPIEELSECLLPLKTVLLLAPSFLKRVGICRPFFCGFCGLYTSTELPCGEGRTNCSYATVPPKRVLPLPSRPSVGG